MTRFSLEDRVVKKPRSEYAGRVWGLWGTVSMYSQLHLVWSEILEVAPKAIRPDCWPEPDGWFWGWNRERSMRDRGYTWGTGK